MRLHWLALLLPLVGCGDPATGTPQTPQEGASSSAGQGAPGPRGPVDPPPAMMPAGSGPITIGIGGGAPADNAPPPGALYAPSPGAADPCTSGVHPPTGDVLRKIQVPGDLRWYSLHIPKNYAEKPAELVLNLHGFTSDPFQEALLSGMNAAADLRGILVAYPSGLSHSWNAGTCCGFSTLFHTDDVGFVRAVIDAIAREYCVDARRIFATGMSNGGFMAHRLGCELSDRIAAVAPVAGLMSLPSCKPPRPVPVMHFHGKLDPLVPYNGSPLLGFGTVQASYTGWTQRDTCGGPEGTTFQKGDSTCVAHSGCRGGSESILCTVSDGGHTWPGGFPIPLIGKTTTDMNATQMMFDFFDRHPMP